MTVKSEKVQFDAKTVAHILLAHLAKEIVGKIEANPDIYLRMTYHEGHVIFDGLTLSVLVRYEGPQESKT